MLPNSCAGAARRSALQHQAAYWGAIAQQQPRACKVPRIPWKLPSKPHQRNRRRAPREPILTLPGALTAYVLLLAVIHAVRMLLPFDLDDLVIETFGFIPKRYDSTLLDVTFPGGAGAKVWTFVTYSLLHANLSHIGFNVLWLLPFGSALARRFGAVQVLCVHGGDGCGRRAGASGHA